MDFLCIKTLTFISWLRTSLVQLNIKIIFLKLGLHQTATTQVKDSRYIFILTVLHSGLKQKYMQFARLQDFGY